MKNPYINTHLIYKHLMRKIDYKGWAEYISDIVEYFKVPPEKFLELAAGDGSMYLYLNNKYPDVILTDISYHMLNNTDDHLNKKVVCDMCRIPFNNKFNFIYATFDSINYLLTESQMLMLFNEVSRVLAANGVFTFDVSLHENSTKNEKQLNRKGKSQGIKYKQMSKYLNYENIHENRFEITLPDGERIIEIHKQKIYDFKKYFEVIDCSNLYVLDCYDFFSFTKANESCDRVQFVLAGQN